MSSRALQQRQQMRQAEMVAALPKPHFGALFTNLCHFIGKKVGMVFEKC
jgi:hypothetical protein